MLILKQLIETKQSKLGVAFIDIYKANDSVQPNLIFNNMRKKSDKLIKAIKTVHKNSKNYGKSIKTKPKKNYYRKVKENRCA